MNRPLIAENETEQQMLDERWGKRLREVRESKDIALEEVVSELHLDIKLLRQIEDEDLGQLPSAPFVKGYLRSYARLLNVNPAPILEAYGRVCGPDAPGLADISRARKRELTSKDNAPRYTTWIIVGVLVVSLLLWWWSQMMTYKKSTEEAAAPEAVSATSAEIPPEQPGTSVVASEGGNGEAVIELPLPEQQQPALTAVEPTPPAAAVTMVPPLDSITLKFSADSWVDITDATGARLVGELAKANTSRTVKGQPPFKVMLGNASAVTVEYNGIPYDHKANAKNGTARFTLGSAD